MVLNDLVDSCCYSLKNAGLKGLKVERGELFQWRTQGQAKMFLSIVTPLTRKVGQIPGSCCIPARCTHSANLVTAGQLLAEIMQI